MWVWRSILGVYSNRVLSQTIYYQCEIKICILATLRNKRRCLLWMRSRIFSLCPSKKVKKRGWKPLPPRLKHMDISRNPGLTSQKSICLAKGSFKQGIYPALKYHISQIILYQRHIFVDIFFPIFILLIILFLLFYLL